MTSMARAPTPAATDEPTFTDLFDLAEIQLLQDRFAAATGVASLITLPDGTPLTAPSRFCRLCRDIIRQTEKGLANCIRSDALIGRPHPEGPVVQPCLSGGLWDAGANITVEGRHLANWLVGQVRNEAQDETAMLAYAKVIGADPVQFAAALHEVPVMSRQQFQHVADALFLFANELSKKAWLNRQQAQLIARQQQTERQLRQEQQKYLGLFDNPLVAVALHEFLFDPAGEPIDYIFLAINGAFCEITGLTEAIIGKKVTEIIPDFAQSPLFRTYGEVIQRQRATTVAQYVEPLDRNYLINAFPLGQRRFATVFLDVSELRRAHEEVQLLNQNLEARVEERTAQLAAANRELEAFSYSVSHDLRAPLRAINGFARILEEDHHQHLDAEGGRVLTVIRSEAKRMGRLIDDLLRFSRLGRQPLRLEHLDMNELVAEIRAELGRDDQARSVVWRCDPLPSVQGDRALVRQMWANLLENACKFSQGRQPPRVTVSARQEGGETVYAVRDNGAGFDMAFVGKLFGVFQRLHRQDEFEGTGVGLALVQRIVHRHHGRIWAQGEPEVGASFYFTIGGTPEETT